MKPASQIINKLLSRSERKVLHSGDAEISNMCGVFGYCSDQDTSSMTESFDRCRDQLRLRGPDSAENYEDRGLYLGFRRLAILDLSAEGNQPMTTPDGRYTIVFNGEIYNFLELRADLERQGEVFRGHSDTEVLLNLYSRHGVHCFERLNGMFAFGIYDKCARTLVLVRDRLGVKPLYYWRQGKTMAFASEVQALRCLTGFPSGIDTEVLGFYFRTGMIPEWSSIYPGLSKMPPGGWARYHLDTGTMDGPLQYWDLPQVGEEDARSDDDWVDEIEAVLWDATRLRLRSDVPLGIFLSGGIDSGLVAAAATGPLKGLTSITIGFEGESADETGLALTTARHLELNPIVRNVDLREGMETLPTIMAHFDEPFSDTSALPTSLVCAEARKDFTVVLSGDGGDEVFGGYENHVRAWKWRCLDRIPLTYRRMSSSVLAAVFADDSLPKRFIRRLGQPVGRFGLGGHVYPFQDWLNKCLKPEYNLKPERIIDLYNKHLPIWKDASCIDMAQRMDLRTSMLEDILIKIDRMSMMNSLELRSPFLDYRLVELGLKIPSRLRVKNGKNKYLLRRLAARHLPETVCRAPKRGFGIPIRSWLSDDAMAHSLIQTLTMNQNAFPDPFNNGGAERIWRLGQINPALTGVVIMLLCYRWWCRGQIMTYR